VKHIKLDYKKSGANVSFNKRENQHSTENYSIVKTSLYLWGKIFSTLTQKTIIVSVTNDLSTDQRVHKSCMELIHLGFTPLLVGRKLPESLPIERPYPTHRMRLFFRRKFWFYAEYQIRLFFFLLFKKSHGLLANDLDTLLPNFLISKIKSIPIIYDSHEYYCYTPELIHRPRVQKVWMRVEKWIFPKLKTIITVNKAIAWLYNDAYGKNLYVVRNISPFPENIPVTTRKDWNIPEEAFIFINQGSGINIDRGMEEMLEALPHLPKEAHLLIVGRGDVLPVLKKRVENNADLANRVHFISPQPYATLLSITRLADCGLSLDKTDNPNYKFSLPNKLFDYIHSGIPVLGSQVIEVKSIIHKDKIGEVIENHQREEIARTAKIIMSKGKSHYREALQASAKIHTWEKEQEVLRRALKDGIACA
jgi:glycosyltransferase involved in cell wall biosynthesis